MSIKQVDVVIATTVKVNIHDCPSCGVSYAITVEFDDRRRKDGRTFYCPNGHAASYDSGHEQEVKRLKDEAELAKRRADIADQTSRNYAERLETERKSHASTKGQLTKTRNRIQAGHCPECHQFFGQLKRHMESEHPVESQAAETAVCKEKR